MRREAAFTLAELLLALAVTAILVLMLTNVVSATLTAWQQGRNRLDTFSNARQLIGRIADEIAAAMAAKDQIEFVENSGSLGGNAPIARTSENVFFVAPYLNPGAGDLCVIAYRHNAAEHRLERAFKDSAGAWAPGPATRYRIAGYTGANALSWRPVAAGVIDFEIRSYSQQNLDSGQEYDDPGSPIAASWNSAAAGMPSWKAKLHAGSSCACESWTIEPSQHCPRLGRGVRRTTPRCKPARASSSLTSRWCRGSR